MINMYENSFTHSLCLLTSSLDLTLSNPFNKSGVWSSGMILALGNPNMREALGSIPSMPLF